jgi:hypothetical protein
MKQPLYILRLALVVLLPLLMAMAPAMAQTYVYRGETTPLSVIQVPGNTYKWELYSDPTVNFAKLPGNCPITSALFVGGNTGPSVNVQWLKTGTYFFKVTAVDAATCTNNLKIGIVIVKDELPTALFTPPDAICIGETGTLSVTFTGTAPWEFTYSDGTNFWTITGITSNQYLLNANPKTTTSYWITEVKDKNGTTKIRSANVVLEVKPKPVSSKIYLYQP